MFWNGWEPLLRVLTVGALAYVGLILILRISGKRTLSKMNAFDFVVTVALGSTLATVLLNADVSLAEGVAAFALLAVLQFIVSWSTLRWAALKHLVTAEPRMLVWQGEYLRTAMRQERVRENEILAQVRQAGLGSVREAAAVVLETDGSISVVTTAAEADASALHEMAPADEASSVKSN